MRTSRAQSATIVAEASIAPTTSRPQTDPIIVVASQRDEPSEGEGSGVRGEGRGVREGASVARSGGRHRPRRRARMVEGDRLRGPADDAALYAEDALSDRVDHEDVHRDRDHAASRRGQARPRRSRSRAHPGARRRVRHTRAADDPADALPRVRAPERAAGDGLDACHVRERSGADARASGRHLHHRPSEHAVEVLEPRVPAAGRDRRARERRPLPALRADEAAVTAEDDFDGVQPAASTVPAA